jgi:flagellar basal-body rod modification protein FlgD
MSDIKNVGGSININQNPFELMQTKNEVDFLNKAITKDGKQQVKDLGKDQFLQLLLTELKYQDPTNPMQDREFIAQMAQFSSLEQMLNFNKSMSKLLDNVNFQSSFDLLGHYVELDNGKFDQAGNKMLAAGIVESVNRVGSEVFIKVNGEDYSVNSIVSVNKL